MTNEHEHEHYYKIGIREGQTKFNWVNFILGLGIGISIGILAMLIAK